MTALPALIGSVAHLLYDRAYSTVLLAVITDEIQPQLPSVNEQPIYEQQKSFTAAPSEFQHSKNLAALLTSESLQL